MFIAAERLLHAMLKLHFDIHECVLTQIDATCIAHESSDVRIERFFSLGQRKLCTFIKRSITKIQRKRHQSTIHMFWLTFCCSPSLCKGNALSFHCVTAVTTVPSSLFSCMKKVLSHYTATPISHFLLFNSSAHFENAAPETSRDA